MQKKNFRLFKSVVSFLVLFTLFGSIFSVPLHIKAVDVDLKTEALEKGAAWIVSKQLESGGWTESRDPGTTSLALSALTAHAKYLGVNPLSEDYDYHENVQKAIDYIFLRATKDSENSFVHWGVDQIYVLGPAIMAISSVETPDEVINIEGSSLNGMTHKQVVQQVVNFIGEAQVKSGPGIGLWYYYHPTTSGDMSISGWVTLGLMYAKDKFNITIPQTLLDYLDEGIDIVLFDSDPTHPLYGGAGYISGSTNETSYQSWVNIHKVGHLLAMLELVGDPITSPRVQAVLTFIQRHYNAPNSGASGVDYTSPYLVNDYLDVGWRGGPNGNDPYPSYNATLTLMKGLLAYGIDTLTVAEEPVVWQDDFDEVIIDNQDALGFWQSGGYPNSPSEQYRVYYTAWAMMTLLRSVPTIAVTGVSLTCPQVEIKVGDTLTLTGNVLPIDATNSTISWTSSDPTIATINNGVLTALKAGTTTITITSEDGGFVSSCTITVVKKVTGVTLACPSESLIAGGSTLAITPNVLPVDASNKTLVWASSDAKVASVVNGVVTPLAVGNTTISATTNDGGFKATCAIEVVAPNAMIDVIVEDQNKLQVKANNLENAVLFSASEALNDSAIKLVVKSMEANSVFVQDKTLLEAYAKENIKADATRFVYLDVSLFKIVGQIQTQLTSSLEPITISFILPQELRDKDFQLLRVHDNKVEKLEYTYNKETFEITFTTDKFSTYAMVYGVEDQIIDTSDPQNNAGYLLLIGVLLLFVSSFAQPKKEEKR